MNERIRILLLVDSMVVGGAEQVVADLATHLDPRRFAVTVCTTREEGPLAPALRTAGVPVMVIGRLSRWDIGGAVRLWRYLRRGRFDVLHAHKFGSNVWARLLGRSCGIAVVIAHEHSWDYRTKGMGRVRALTDRILTRFCDVVVTPSNADRRAWERVIGVAPRKLVTIHNGVAAPRSHSDSLRREYSLPEGAVVIGAVGRLETQKGYDLLLRAFALLGDQQPQARLVLIGDGGERARLEALARDLSIADRVILSGYRYAASGFMTQFDVFASASKWEGLPLALIEAMSVGRPVIATRVGGVPEVVVDGETGLLTPNGDVERFAERLEQVVADPALRERLGRNARARYRTLFTVERMVGDTEDLYLTLLNAAASPRRDGRRKQRRMLPA